jgi:hypothetical protein
LSGPTAAQMQRLLAEEFERRGWEYDLSTGRAIVDEITRFGSVDAHALAQVVPGGFLARARATRRDIEDAIVTALRGVDFEAAEMASAGNRREMRVLFVAAGPDDQPRLRLDAEHREIRSRIRSSTARNDVAIDTALAARPTDLIDELNRFRPTILHLAGHGGPTGIALEDHSGNASDVTTDQLVRLVSLSDPELRLVVLNSCASANQAEPLAEHVDAAIGMARGIVDDSAREFAAQLYSSLAEGVTLDRAFEHARLQMSLAGLAGEDEPELFVRRGIDAGDMAFTH